MGHRGLRSMQLHEIGTDSPVDLDPGTSLQSVEITESHPGKSCQAMAGIVRARLSRSGDPAGKLKLGNLRSQLRPSEPSATASNLSVFKQPDDRVMSPLDSLSAAPSSLPHSDVTTIGGSASCPR